VNRHWRIRIQFEPRDIWIGVYWTKEQTGRGRLLTLYICLVPMLPITLQIFYHERR